MNFHEMIVNTVSFWWLLFPSYQPLPYQSFEKPGVETVGLVRDEERDLWWANDLENREIRFYADDTRKWETALSWGDDDFGAGDPGPMALAGDTLHVVVEEAATGHIRSYDVTEVPLRENSPRIEIPPSARRPDPSITGLAFDGDFLWLVTDCGLCSTLIQFNRWNGEELFDFFPACAARGITYRSPLPFSKGTLWMIGYNGTTKPPLLSRRRITGDPSVVNTSRDYFALRNVEDPPMGPPGDPTAIAVRGFDFWVVDRSADQIKRYSAVDLP